MEKWFTVIIAVLITIIFCGILLLFYEKPAENAILISTNAFDSSIKFEIYGAVNKPGIYDIKSGSRVSDGISLAGGFSKNADNISSHQSAFIHDGDIIIIPTRTSEEIFITTTPFLNLLKKIDLNSAGKEELMTLPGIGNKKAEDILSLRKSRNGFTSINDLLDVTGIGQHILDQINDLIIIGPYEDKK